VREFFERSSTNSEATLCPRQITGVTPHSGYPMGFASRAGRSAGAFEFFEWKAPIGDRNCQPGDVERRQFGRRKSHLSGFRHFLSLK